MNREQLAHILRPTEDKADAVDGAIGELSPFHEMNGVYAQGVSVRTAVPPWEMGSISHAVNVRKGPLYLQWGNTIDGSQFVLTTVNIDHYLPGIKDATDVPELAAFKARP